MSENEGLARQFETHRAHLRAVAGRILGSRAAAEDAVQEAWLRLARSNAGEVENLRGWLTTVVARVCLDVLRSRRVRREEPLGSGVPQSPAPGERDAHPEREALLADSVGLALVTVLDRLAPAERVAFVLHDLFDVAFDDVARILERTPTAARQLASRARRRVRGAEQSRAADPARQRRLVEAFLAASRAGDFSALLQVLDPEVVVRADAAAVRMGSAAEVRGAQAVAETFKGRAQAAAAALVDGLAGLVWSHGGQARVAFLFTTRDERIVSIELVADPERLAGLNIAGLDA